MSDNTFDSEKKYKNVQSSRTKGRWAAGSGVDQGKANAMSKGMQKSPREVFMEAIDILGGKKKKGG
jgi:hypothetical protein